MRMRNRQGSLQNIILNRTIDKLMTAAKQKGMKNSIGSHMLR